MADIFGQMLAGDVGYEQPVGAGGRNPVSVFSSLATLTTGMSSTTSTRPTEDQTFDLSWNKYIDKQIGLGKLQKDVNYSPGSVSMEVLRGFGKAFPSLEDSAFARAETAKNIELSEFNTVQSAMSKINEEYIESGMYALVEAEALALENNGQMDEANRLRENGAENYIKEKGTLARIDIAIKKGEGTEKLSDQAWEAIKPGASSRAAIVSQGVTELYNALMLDPNSEFDFEKQNLSGIFEMFPQLTTKVINRKNIKSFIGQIKQELVNFERKKLDAQGEGYRDRPSEWDSEVFKSLDLVSGWIENDLAPSEIVKRMQNSVVIQATTDPEVKGAMDALALLDVSQMSANPMLYQKFLGSYSETIMSYLKTQEESAPARLKQLQNSSTQDLEDARSHFGRLLLSFTGQDPLVKTYPEVKTKEIDSKVKECLTGIIDCNATLTTRNGVASRITSDGYSMWIEKNSDAIIQEANNDSEFGQTVVDGLANDMTVDVAKVKEVTSRSLIDMSVGDDGVIKFNISPDNLGTLGFVFTKEQADNIFAKTGKKVNPNVIGKVTPRIQKQIDNYIAKQLGVGQYDPNMLMPIQARRMMSGARILESGVVEDVPAGDLSSPIYRRSDYPDGIINVEDFKYKWNVVGQLGDVGKSIHEIVKGEFDSTSTLNQPIVDTNVPTNGEVNVETVDIRTSANNVDGNESGVTAPKVGTVSSSNSVGGDTIVETTNEGSGGGSANETDPLSINIGPRPKSDPFNSIRWLLSEPMKDGGRWSEFVKGKENLGQIVNKELNDNVQYYRDLIANFIASDRLPSGSWYEDVDGELKQKP